MEYIRTILAKNLLYNRKLNNLTQAQLSEKLGITSASYNRWENGINWPDPESIEKLAAFYGIRSSAFYQDPNVLSPVQDIEPPINKKEIIKKLEELIDLINR
jgi:transcriptional regulator with XRE-family HTH domain